MTHTDPMSVQMTNDAELVKASLAGNRGAFRQIVVRYQRLVCSLAYSATGSLGRSEDLAQETFVTAWQQLTALREPTKLRAWLCGIVHNLTRNAQRRAGHDPVHLAEPFDPAIEAVATEASPSEQAVSREEEAILWRALEKLPETYRVPLVLFYRERRSVESVARELDLSNDAVKQRLARGRAMLHEQVLAFVEGTLERSAPGRAFALDVMAALPAVGTGAAMVAGLATGKGATGAKSVSWLGALGAVFTAQVLWFVSTMAFVVGFGGYAGWLMHDPKQSAAERRWVARFWRMLVLGAAVFVLPALGLEHQVRSHPEYAGVITVWLGLFYVVAGVPLGWWVILNHRRIRGGGAAVDIAMPSTKDRTGRWVAVATIVAAGLMVVGMADSHWYERIRPEEVWGMVTANPRAEIRVNEQPGSGRWIDLVVAGPERTARYHGPLNEATYQKLKYSGIRFETRVKGRDHEVIGWPERRLGLVAVLVLGAGSGWLVRAWVALRKGRGSQAVAAP